MGKDINFTTQGEDTELDKTVLEQLGDPLIHIVRNAVDHGIETTEQRLAAGKPPQGQIKIIASNEGTQVVIQIIDDGKGLNAEFLKRKAVEKKVVSAAEAQAMTDAQAYLLIFAAGFSTAEKVTDVSGRGVGMDVVRTNLNHLHGTIQIDTHLGQGTTFTIKLPTSLMVSKGVLLRANHQEFILPMGQTRDLVKIPRRQIATFNHQRIAQIRGKIYPLASLTDILGEGPCLQPGPDTVRHEDDEDECSVAIIQNNDHDYGLVVDRFDSEVEIIVKPLTDTLGELKTYLGAAIMGDGRLVLVLNPAELVTNPATLAA
jgi:two-component system chemotaxis sensor kinase CheA